MVAAVGVLFVLMLVLTLPVLLLLVVVAAVVLQVRNQGFISGWNMTGTELPPDHAKDTTPSLCYHADVSNHVLTWDGSNTACRPCLCLLLRSSSSIRVVSIT